MQDGEVQRSTENDAHVNHEVISARFVSALAYTRDDTRTEIHRVVDPLLDVKGVCDSAIKRVSHTGTWEEVKR